MVEAGKSYKRVSPTPNEYERSSPPLAKCGTRSRTIGLNRSGKIVTPTVIADGEYDEAIRREHTEEIAREIQGARLLILPGVSHFAHRQNRDLYNRELTNFLNSRSMRPALSNLSKRQYVSAAFL